MKDMLFSVCILLLFHVCNGDKSECDCVEVDKFSCGDCVCIPRNLVCDGQPDCDNGQDEKGCVAQSVTHSHCPIDHYTCWNLQCVKKNWVCDGDNDCGDNSDELMCPPKNCTEDEFQCNNNNCVLKKWQCDGDDDCKDWSDEHHCVHECTSAQFRCKNDSTCIDKTWACDKEYDCIDQSDEASCGLESLFCGEQEFTCKQAHRCIPLQKRCDQHNDCNNWEDEVSCGFEALVCPMHQFTCTQSHQCLPINKRCDSVNDCGDWEDEMNCDFKPEKESQCKEGEFQCDYGQCINSKWVCDGQRDCEDLSDEWNCNVTRCGAGMFQCGSNTSRDCIDLSKRCNQVRDCPDNSDEDKCVYSECQFGQFRCNNGQCIGNSKVCDTQSDCSDFSDETHCQWTVTCAEKNGGCDQLCEQKAHGARCVCNHGFILSQDGHSCFDVDECTLFSPCSHNCKNTLGSFECSCSMGYVLKPDGKGCKAQSSSNEKAYLIFANRVDIRRVMPDMSEYDSILNGLENAIALDFHHEKGYVYWSDVTLDKIKRAFLNGTGIKEVVAYGLQNPVGVAVDWIHNNLFWTDSGTSRIEVSNLDGDHRNVLIWDNLEKPRAIVAHPGKGMIFWTDWGSTPKIERSGMDGLDRLVIANTSLFWPNGLTLDYGAEKLYWADAKHHVIECADYDGKHRRTVINQGLPHPFALTLFEDELYWTDWHTKSINKANKFTGNDVEMVRNKLHFPMDIHIFHQERQPDATNRCGTNRGGCSHLCLPGYVGYKCACPTGLHLKGDNKTCVRNIKSFLLFTTRSDVRRITLGTEDQSDVVIPLSKTISTNAVDFDADNDTIFWTDSGTNTISAAKWDGTEERVVVGSSGDTPTGLAVDWSTRKLYWTDTEMGRIEVANLDGSMRAVLIWSGLGQPRDIVVDPISGYMYWTDWQKPPRIERAGMDGQGQMTLISRNLTYPNGLTIDYKGKTTRIFWIDPGTEDPGSIESCNWDGSDRKTVVSMSLSHPQPFGFTLFGDYMYWADWLHKKIVRSDRQGDNQVTIQENMGNVMDITVFNRDRSEVESICQENNGQCSHLCLPAPVPRAHTCICPTGVLLKKDGRTCNTDMRNFLIFAKRTDIRKISLDVGYYADVTLPISNMKNAIAISFDRIEEKVYWTDTILDRIMRADLNGSNVKEVILTGLDTPDGMVVDEIGRKIYWTDTGLNHISVSNLDGTMSKVIIWEDLDKPRAITLFYEESYLFWTDWGDLPKIERSELDGNGRRTLISSSVIWPNGLTVDKEGKRLYWADAKTELIESSDLNGEARKSIAIKVAHPYNIALFGDQIYWTDWQKTSVFSVKQDGSEPDNHRLVLPKLTGIMDIHAVSMDEKVNVRINKCRKNNGHCSHLCLPNRRGITCACPSGLQLRNDGINCQSMPDEYILFASRGSIRRISLDTPDRTDVFLPLSNLQNVIAIDYDFTEDKIYYTDVQLDVIRRANLNGSGEEVIIRDQLKTTDGLAVDWLGKNLYWTDTGTDIIEVARLTGEFRKKLITEDLDQPRAIALFPEKGLMYWTDWGYRPRIESAYMDGSNRKVLHNSGLGFPNGLSIDYATERLYWADGKLDKIETSTLDGTFRVTLIRNVPHPFGLSVFGPYVYWTDWQKQQIERADKSNGKSRETIKQLFVGLMDIEVVSPHRQFGSNSCSKSNGGCSHLCLARPDGHSCLCPDSPSDSACVPKPFIDRWNTTVNNEPEDIGIRGASCTESEIRSGLCTSTARNQKSKSSQRGIYITLSIVTLIVALGVILIIVLWKRQRKRKQFTEDLSFAFINPNYQRTSTETINSDRHVRDWRIFRFNKKSERVSVGSSSCVSDEKLNVSETEALYGASSDIEGPSCFPDGPLSKNIFKPKNSDPKRTNRPKRVPYKPVDPKVT